MDRLYKEERASRERVWKSLLELTEEDRRRPHQPREESLEKIRQPLSIEQVKRAHQNDSSNRLEINYPSNSNYRRWICTFCGENTADHVWSSFQRETDRTILPRWQPPHCTLYKLFDQVARDFFPGRRVFLDSERSHLRDRIRLIFHDIDELATPVSTTWIWMDKDDSEEKTEAFAAMKINEQLELLKNWLTICQNPETDGYDEEFHEHCQQVRKDSGIPAKRVLSLVATSTGMVHLVETAGRTDHYVALSHCWGDRKRHPLMTTRANLKDHMNGIRISDLPRSFRDAITVCCYLGIQYLWIDCLCVVQDDSIEWLAEANNMAQIYEKSHITIAATRAQNSQHGFLFDFVDDTVHYDVTVDAPWSQDASESRTLHTTLQIDHESSKSDSTPVNSRAWCLQEWYLPRRLVEFCLNDIRFICLRTVETRFGTTTDGDTKTRTIVRGFGMRDESFFRKLWEHIREDFFTRKLTKPSDILPALAGLAQMLERALFTSADHRYLAGLWTTRLSEDLSWGAHGFEPTTRLIEGLPTWSWASTSASCGYIYGRPFKTFVDLVEASCSGYARPIEKPAFLKVKGFLASVYLRVDHRQEDHEGRPSLSFWLNEISALNTTTENVQMSEKASENSHFFVLDMPICPAPHDHRAIQEVRETGMNRVPTVIRASENLGKCRFCTAKGYVSEVKLLLLTQTDSAATVLVLAPVIARGSREVQHSREMINDTYQRLGLLEIDCIRRYPWFKAADGFKVPMQTFWKTGSPTSRSIITLV